jgi:phenylpropionate dioxygenase-like ring-hydroxylating dioxygenase large terminal subunit
MTTSFDSHPLHELVHPDRVHASLYTDRQVFAAEMERVFGATWVYLAHESEIPGPNDFVRKRLGLRPVIVTRDRNSSIHVLINRCTHRGATVCRNETGTAKNFVCPYHNWSFDNTGRLIGVPMKGGYGNSFDASNLGLGRVRTQSYRGFVFATLNPEMPDLEEHLGPATTLIDQWLDRWPGAELQVRSGRHRLSYRGNWKLTYDNSADGYHPGYSHASLLKMRKERYGVGVDMQWVLGDVDSGLQTVTDLGNGHTFLDQRAEIDEYWSSAAPMPGGDRYADILRERLGHKAAAAALDVAVGSGMNLNIFPNLLIIGNQIQVIEPYGVADTTLVWYSTRLVARDLPDEVNTLRMRLQEDFPAFGEPDDLANFEECQVGLSVPEMEWVNTSRHLDTGRQFESPDGLPTAPVSSELPVRAFWAEWKRIMTSNAKLAVESARSTP